MDGLKMTEDHQQVRVVFLDICLLPLQPISIRNTDVRKHTQPVSQYLYFLVFLHPCSQSEKREQTFRISAHLTNCSILVPTGLYCVQRLQNTIQTFIASTFAFYTVSSTVALQYHCSTLALQHLTNCSTVAPQHCTTVALYHLTNCSSTQTTTIDSQAAIFPSSRLSHSFSIIARFCHLCTSFHLK